MSSILLNDILKHWTGQPSLESIETEVLEHCVEDNPYSPTLQLLLAKKYQMIASPLLPSQVIKTTAFFPSSLHVHFLLNRDNEGANKMVLDAKLDAILSEQLANFNEVIDETAVLDHEKEANPTLQKDYFGAQGIELDLSKLPQDKFTQQLRSFTAWLKVIKNKDGGPADEQTIVIEADQERKIAQIAEKANVPAEVLTESMAEIWEKQGNLKKAIATFEKLSFIFPEKSVYFASRIEQLKNSK